MCEKDASSTSSTSLSTNILDRYEEQSEAYKSEDVKRPNKDTTKTLRTYVQLVYKDVKFFAERGKAYEQPDFVQGMSNDSRARKSQTLKIAETLIENLGKMYISYMIWTFRHYLMQSTFVIVITSLLHCTGFSHFDIKERVMFWKQYRNTIKSQIQSFRCHDMHRLKTRFIKGTYN